MKFGFIKLLLAFTVFMSLPLTHAADSLTQSLKNIGFHGGSLTEFVGATQVDANGKTETFHFNPMIGFSTEVEMVTDWHLIPEFNWVLPRDAGDGISKNLFMIRGDVGWRYSDYWRLRMGTSIMVNNIRGSGGTKSMNNGSGSSDFYIPAESKTAYNNTLDLGVEALLDDFGFRFQTYIYSPLRSDRRQYSYSLTMSYYYDMEKK
ncbi:MAG: hypothetical protein K2P81_09390 [Bacteriovoracaceae bacterium]|nr:hypothetical protein [Bacteriovoracaceae bacterium]